MRLKLKTVMDQMNAEKPDDVLADLEAKHGLSPSAGSTFRWKPMDVAYGDNLRKPRRLVLELNPKYPAHCYTTCSESDGIGNYSDHSMRTREE